MTDSPERRFIDAMYEAALEYIDRGWPVFPVNIETKHPLIEWKSKQTETTDIEEVTDWFTNGVLTEDGDRIKLFNIGMATGALPGIVVVDCDNDGAIDFAKKNNLTSPVSVKTTRGVHYYWAHPGHGKQFRNKNGGQGKDWPNMKGLDFRGDGGYVILPPSMSFNADGSAKAVYQFDMQADFDDLPVWGGVPSHVEEFSDGSFSFSDIDFSGVHSGPPEPDIELQIRDQVALLGRSLVVGEGTDNWMIRLCGQLVRRGVLGEDLKAKVHSIYETYFSDNNTAQETARWLDVKMRSAMQMDRSNYPEDYDASGNRIIQQKAVASVDSAVSFFTYGTAPHFLSNIKLQKFYTDPLLPAGNIIQVLGYNGHGKSFFLNSLLTALTAGRAEFGPYAMSGAIPKVLYFDYDNPARTLLERVISQGRAYGDPGNNLKYWSSSVLSTARSQNMNLGTEEGARTLISLVEQEKPEIVTSTVCGTPSPAWMKTPRSHGPRSTPSPSTSGIRATPPSASSTTGTSPAPTASGAKPAAPRSLPTSIPRSSSRSSMRTRRWQS
jgi:hypothetical protein